MLELEGTLMVIFSNLLLLLRQKLRSRTVTHLITRDLPYHLLLIPLRRILPPLLGADLYSFVVTGGRILSLKLVRSCSKALEEKVGPEGFRVTNEL